MWNSKLSKVDKQRKISRIMQQSLLLCLLAAFFVTTVLTYILQTQLSMRSTKNLLRLNIEDVRQDIMDASDKNLLAIAHEAAKNIDGREVVSKGTLINLMMLYNVAEINIIDENGIITTTTHDPFLNYDMASGIQSGEFMVLLNGESEYVQSYQPTSYDPTLSRKYAGVVLKKGGFVQVGYDFFQFQKNIDSHAVGTTRNRRIGANGCIIITDEDWTIVSDRNNYEGKNLNKTGFSIDTAATPEWVLFETNVYGEPSYCMYTFSEGYYIISVMLQSEATISRDLSVKASTVMEIAVMILLFVMIYVLIRRLVVNNIYKINGTLAKITEGDLNVSVDVHSNAEFSSLSNDINSTVEVLKRYISEAEARIDAELEFARTIQHSSLPSVFPPFPQKTEFDIYACMYTAKEVGGDFYDFYLVDENTLAILAADVSGKGIPAALFMMTAKTLIKSCAESGMAVQDVFTLANEKLCENNEAGMFVTAWMGLLNLKTGVMTIANAGHNPPLVRRANGSFEYLKGRAGLVLAGMENIRYRSSELQFNPGDEIFLYTDGVTEATNADEELYGEDRLANILNFTNNLSMQELCLRVKEDVDAFVGHAPQFDDITMLALRFLGSEKQK